jgi:hypothetical protein
MAAMRKLIAVSPTGILRFAPPGFGSDIHWQRRLLEACAGVTVIVAKLLYRTDNGLNSRGSRDDSVSRSDRLRRGQADVELRGIGIEAAGTSWLLE